MRNTPSPENASTDIHQNLVKPPNGENPRQSSTFVWRMSYAPAAILKSSMEKAPGSPGLFPFRRDKSYNSFDWKYLAVSHLE
jgi:hypothetical protein